MDTQTKIRYARQMIIPEIGELGQQKILDAKVLVIGAGGLGSPALLYLCAAGVGSIGIAEFDKVELGNLQRQIIHEFGDVGRSKAESAKDSLLDINPDVKIEVFGKITAENAKNIFAKYDLILDGSDNYQTRFLVNDVCLKLQKTLVSGAILKFDGQVAAFQGWKNDEEYPCYRCLYAEEPGDMPNCATNGIFASVGGIIGSIMVHLALKIICGIEDGVHGWLHVFDGKKMQFRKVKLKKDKACGCSAEAW